MSRPRVCGHGWITGYGLVVLIGQIAAVAAVLMLSGLVCFQLLLAAGLPLGHYAWGGTHRVLPPALRISSIFAIVIYVLAALIILEAANVTNLVASAELPRTTVWGLAVFFAIGVVMNAVSRSHKERRMAVLALALSALCVVVALGP